MIGIYRFKNKINGKVYIGQSIDIEARRYGHTSASFNPKAQDYNSKIHQAIRKYGIDNFEFDILVQIKGTEYSKELLNYLEEFFISKYNSFKRGYNATPGGDANNPENTRGEKNGRALLTEEDVYYIRECYNNHIPFRVIYDEYSKKGISKRCLQKVWQFENWTYIHPEYYNRENRYWHSHNAKANSSEVASNNQRSFSNEEVRTFRNEYYNNGLSIPEIFRKYEVKTKQTTLRNAILKITYKDV